MLEMNKILYRLISRSAYVSINMADSIRKVTLEAQACMVCGDLPLGPRPVFTLHNKAKIVIIGQAPGTKVHASGIPWDDVKMRHYTNGLLLSWKS